MAVDAVAVVFAAVSLFFFTLAVFVWAQDRFGTVATSLALGFLYLMLSVGLYISHRKIQRAEIAPRPEPAQTPFAALGSDMNPEWLTAPVVIAAGIEVLRRIGASRMIPAFALSAVAVAAAHATAHSARANQRTNVKEDKKSEQRRT